MSIYDAIKILHILGTVLIFGTGMGTAFFLLMAYRTADIDAIRVTARHVVIADWLFTMPAVVLQPITGVLLMHILGIRFDTAWFLAVVALYALTGACWIRVVTIQYRLRDLASAAASYAELPAQFHRLMRWWIVLGVPAFTAVLLIVVLMVTHAGAGIVLDAKPPQNAASGRSASHPARGPVRSMGIGRRRAEQGPRTKCGDATPKAERPATHTWCIKRNPYGAGTGNCVVAARAASEGPHASSHGDRGRASRRSEADARLTHCADCPRGRGR